MPSWAGGLLEHPLGAVLSFLRKFHLSFRIIATSRPINVYLKRGVLVLLFPPSPFDQEVQSSVGVFVLSYLNEKVLLIPPLPRNQ